MGGVLARQRFEPFATFINGVPKYVATSTPLDREWANSTVIDGGLVEFVRDLKEQDGGDIGVHASISVAQALLAAGLVDELRLVFAPTIVGSGRRLLDGVAIDQARIDPERDLTDRLPARRLPRDPLALGAPQDGAGEAAADGAADGRRRRARDADGAADEDGATEPDAAGEPDGPADGDGATDAGADALGEGSGLGETYGRSRPPVPSRIPLRKIRTKTAIVPMTNHFDALSRMRIAGSIGIDWVAAAARASRAARPVAVATPPDVSAPTSSFSRSAVPVSSSVASKFTSPISAALASKSASPRRSGRRCRGRPHWARPPRAPPPPPRVVLRLDRPR